MINIILVCISITLSIILVILLFYIKHLKSEQSDEEKEPLFQKYNNISLSEELLSRLTPKRPRIQKTREITNNFNSGDKIEDTFSILDKIDKEESLIVHQLGQYCQSFNEQRRLDLDSEFNNGNLNRASSSQRLGQPQQPYQDPIDLDQIQSNLLAKSYGKSIPNHNTLDILRFKLYQQELEKKKKDKSVYSNVYNHYGSTLDHTHSTLNYTTESSYIQPDPSRQSHYTSLPITSPSHSITIDDPELDQDSSLSKPFTHHSIEPNTSAHKPPLYSPSLKSHLNSLHTTPSTNTSTTNNNNNRRRSSVLSSSSSNINDNDHNHSNNTNDRRQSLRSHSSSSLTKLNPPSPLESEHHSSSTKENTPSPINTDPLQKDSEALTSPISNDGSVVTSLTSPSGILSSPQGTKLFNDMSSLSIIVPKNVDDSMELETHPEPSLPVLQETSTLSPSSRKSSVDHHPESPRTTTTPTSPPLTSDPTSSPHYHAVHSSSHLLLKDPNTSTNSIVPPSQSFIDVSINNNISNAIEGPEYEDDYSINYSHSLSQRRRSTDNSSKRRSKNSFGSSASLSKTMVSSSLFSSSLPPINRPTRVQSLKRKASDLSEKKKSMAKAQDYIALSQRSFPVRANFIPDIYYDDEIKLNVGDLVVIKDVYLDSWAKGINIMTNSSGVFPLCYLNTDEPQAQAKTKRFTQIVNQDDDNE